MRAHPRRGGCYYRINAVGDERVRQICKAINDGLPVVFGTQVDQAFTRNDGDYVINTPDGSATIGGHAMTIIGYSYRPGQGFLLRCSTVGATTGDRAAFVGSLKITLQARSREILRWY